MKKADVKLWDLESCKYLKFIFDNDHSVTHESSLCYTSVPAADDKDLACDVSVNLRGRISWGFHYSLAQIFSFFLSFFLSFLGF